MWPQRLGRETLTGAGAITVELATVRNELGQAMAQLNREAGISWRDLGARFEMSHTQARIVAEQAANPQTELVPIMQLEDARAILEGFGTVARIVQGFEPMDALLASGLPPSAFALGGSIRVPRLLLQNEAGVWVGVRDCLCGYGGTGPHNTIDLLAALGIGGDLRWIVMAHRYIDVPVIDGEIRPEHGTLEREPRVDVRPPSAVVDGVAIATLDQEWLGAGRMTPVPFGRKEADGPVEPSGPPPGDLQVWAEKILLADDPPAWATGELRARCYLDRDALKAVEIGRGSSIYPNAPVGGLILERGQLQVWCPAPPPWRRHELFSSDTRKALDLLQFAPSGEPEGFIDRVVQRIAGFTLPPFIELPEGKSLTHDPLHIATRLGVPPTAQHAA